ncbi:MAG: hypothetical protein IJS05_07750 [Paludibacteraceae bacterium]|nr:hypothetical protein [Paludibacteraceae bacterium]
MDSNNNSMIGNLISDGLKVKVTVPNETLVSIAITIVLTAVITMSFKFLINKYGK